MVAGIVLSGSVPINGWWIFGGILLLMLISGIASLLSTLRTASTSIVALKSIVGMIQGVKDQTGGPALALPGPVDLKADHMMAAVLMYPSLTQAWTKYNAIQQARRSRVPQAPPQLVTPRLAAAWGQLPPPPGAVQTMSEVHARPLPPTPAGDRMVIWVTGRTLGTRGISPALTEYWTFITSVPLARIPANCPSCGAPTANTTSTGICSYCQATLVPIVPPGSIAKATWVVDDISLTPPAEVANAA